MEIKHLREESSKVLNKTKNLEDLDKVYREYLGKKGKISLVFDNLRHLSLAKRKEIGRELNQLKKEVKTQIENKKRAFLKAAKIKQIDVTLPGKKISLGHLHPLTKVVLRCEEIFEKMGFSVVEGPEIENEWYNFDALNIPKDHPARDLWNTLWLKSAVSSQQSANNKSRKLSVGSGKLLLRTHTSPVQVRYLEKNNPPSRIIVPGRVFRYEATDPSHEIQFYQLEGLMVDKNISVANFKGIIRNFLEEFFRKKVQIRMRPGYFPFTEPSFEVDIRGATDNKQQTTKEWVELMGGGMVHPNVFKAARLNPKDWQGFAFGIGVDRLAMMKYKIDDIRLFYGGDLRFLHQF